VNLKEHASPDRTYIDISRVARFLKCFIDLFVALEGFLSVRRDDSPDINYDWITVVE